MAKTTNSIKNNDDKTAQELQSQLLDIFQEKDIRLLPESIMSLLLSNDRDKQVQTFRRYLELHRNPSTGDIDLSVELTAMVYEREMAQRHNNKQDYTPTGISCLASLLTVQEDKFEQIKPKTCAIHEPTGGTGALIIARWNDARLRIPLKLFRPSLVPITTWEIDFRPLPFLLLNIAVRGCVATVYHGDVLNETLIEHNGEKAIYLVCNPLDDPLHFSHILKVTKDNLHQIIQEARQTSKQIQTLLKQEKQETQEEQETQQLQQGQALADLATLFD